MPPHQCPECGRFLKNALVEGLATAPAPCPKCEVELTAELFGPAEATPSEATPVEAGPGPAVAPATSASPLAGADPASTASPAAPTDRAVPERAAASVRPPDLEPGRVRDAADPLAGWDAGLPPPPVEDRRPFPTDTVLVAAGAGVGALAGALASDRQLRGGVVGAVAGAVATGAVRRIWQLPDT